MAEAVICLCTDGLGCKGMEKILGEEFSNGRMRLKTASIIRQLHL